MPRSDRKPPCPRWKARCGSRFLEEREAASACASPARAWVNLARAATFSSGSKSIFPIRFPRRRRPYLNRCRRTAMPRPSEAAIRQLCEDLEIEDHFLIACLEESIVDVCETEGQLELTN